METTLKFANMRPDVSFLADLMREEQDILDRAVRGYLCPDRPTIKMIHEQVGVAIKGRNRQRAALGLTPLAAPSQATVRRAIRRLDPFQVIASRKGDNVARIQIGSTTAALDPLRPSGTVEIDDWVEDVNACPVATGLMPPKARKTMSAARLSVTVTTCRATRMILELEVSSDAHAKFGPKSPDKANPEGQLAPVPAGAECIPSVPELNKSDERNAFFATATSNQFINQEAV